MIRKFAQLFKGKLTMDHLADVSPAGPWNLPLILGYIQVAAFTLLIELTVGNLKFIPCIKRVIYDYFNLTYS